MKKLFAAAAMLFLFGMGGVGCQNTAEGAKEDTAKNASAVDKAADNAAVATKDAAKDMSAAVSLTPKVKDAIVGDPTLNDPANHIDVDSKDNVVHLKGTVISNEMKKRAGEIAQKTLTDLHATDKLSNELVVQKH